MTTATATLEPVAAVEETATLDDLIRLCEKRSSTYGFIARLFRVEVDPQFLEELRAMRFPAKSGNEKIDEGYRRIARFMGKTWKSTLTELAIDYVRTFIGHGVDGFSAAYPYESVYTSEKRLLMQDARDDVLMIYRAAGLDKCSDWKDMEDHLALELEYMQILTNRTLAALRAGDEGEAVKLLEWQANFMEDHLQSWVPMMTADMKKFAKTELYQGLAWLTEGFLEEDAAFLGGVLAED